MLVGICYHEQRIQQVGICWVTGLTVSDRLLLYPHEDTVLPHAAFAKSTGEIPSGSMKKHNFVQRQQPGQDKKEDSGWESFCFFWRSTRHMAVGHQCTQEITGNGHTILFAG